VSDDGHRLEVLSCVCDLAAKLDEVGEAISYTRFHRWHGFSDPLLSEALKAGCDLGVFKWAAGNWYSAKKSGWQVPELAYYACCKDSLGGFFRNEQGYKENEFYFEVTAHRDSKIAGRWTRPDLTMVSFRTFAWTIGQEFDVTTFEIKRPDSCDVLAVFEALSHASAATRAYAVFPLSEGEWHNRYPEQAERVLDECSRHGVGLFLIEDVTTNPRPVQRLAAARRTIDHERCGNFLEAVLSEAGLRRIAGWKR
jgi:hypothetical protein